MYQSFSKLFERGELDDSGAREFLATVGFTDPAAAYERLTQIAEAGPHRSEFCRCLPTLLITMADIADPDGVLIKFDHFLQNVPDKLEMFRFMGDSPRAVEMLVGLYMSSEFLSEILRKNPAYLAPLAQHQHLAELKSRQDFFAAAQESMAGMANDAAQLDALRRYQRWELLRIGACDLFGLADLKSVTVQLSLLADALVQSCLIIAARQANVEPDNFAVIAMGKLGGEELNYSSDIDLIFLTNGDAGSFRRLGQNLIRGINQSTQEGFLYRVDMRLRPWGRSGELVTKVSGYLDYLKSNAMLWEKQALLKGRIIAGEMELGNAFLAEARRDIYVTTPDEVRTGVHRMKQQIEADLKQKGRKFGEVKLGAGSIRDVEFVAQYLQLAYGGKHEQIRTFNTLDALVRLADFGLLNAQEYRILTDGYVFLRKVEHSLQLMHYKQAHTLPKSEEELNYLARRLDFQDSAHFLTHYRKHSEQIRNVYQQHFESDRDPLDTLVVEVPKSAASPARPQDSAEADLFSPEETAQHEQMAARLSNDHLVEVAATVDEDGRWQVTIVCVDHTGQLSLICGLLFVHGFHIDAGNVVSRSYTDSSAGHGNLQRMVAVLTVRPDTGVISEELWTRYAEELLELTAKVHSGDPFEAQGGLARRVGLALGQLSGVSTTLYPMNIKIDNDASADFTVLYIDAADTIGFLYELTNSLALNNIYLARVVVQLSEDRVYDTLYITDDQGHKITDPAQQRELRAATVLTKWFTQLLPNAPNPESALLHFREFVEQMFSRDDWLDEIATLSNSKVLEALARLLGVSDFLWADFLRMQHENLFPVVSDVDGLESAKTKDQLREELLELLESAEDREEKVERLNKFKDREMFRADMRHILGHVTEFGQFASELTDIAEVVVDAAYQLVMTRLLHRYGDPKLKDGSPCPMAVCALGKCGGREMGYASDVELMFVYAGAGRTTGPEQITNTEFYRKLVERIPRTISARRKGIFEIDLRLRPYGKAGALAVSWEAFEQYFMPGSPAWPYERQALVKLRPIGGDEEFGKQVVSLRDRCIYTGEPFDVTAMRGMRERQLRELVKPGTFNAKLSPGGLVDVEYLVQGMQITNGHTDPELRATNTRAALKALRNAGILTELTRKELRKAYVFFRRLIDALRMVRGDARDLTVPPTDSEEFETLARRLNYEDVADLHDDLMRHSQKVQELSHLID
ncbi:glutamine synthetase adenylyltransferase [Symmachiella dynata]|uniref:[protein-PII] uridylyltransferase family protein n=1 Tax=Symmachiella dynata TaxID=2527995 RepID=UPI00118B31C8|nr:glutamine synthetase adenylyltransferase [Symmachiella dynata]QDT46582.1 Glutamate-ammonia-ligase adenylyltransferase [Symmachiella dynata]